MAESTTSSKSPLKLTDNNKDMTDQEFSAFVQSHYSWLIPLAIRLVPEIWEWVEEVEEEEAIAA